MKKLITLSAVLLTVLFLSLTSEEKTVVLIDVGHGGEDPGVSLKDPILEKDVNLQIAQKIQEFNNNPNLEIKLTRNDDKFMSLEERVEYVNTINPNYLISIHANFHTDKEKQGVELYYNKTNSYAEDSKKLAQKLRSGLESEMKIRKTNQVNFTILREVKCPAVMIETGFLSNKKDLAYLTSEEGQTKIAQQILLSLK
jgi:N-acetylmuramoyl-L-alanine amidase